MKQDGEVLGNGGRGQLQELDNLGYAEWSVRQCKYRSDAALVCHCVGYRKYFTHGEPYDHSGYKEI